MKVPLNSREIELILQWKDDVFWPDERRIAGKLQAALGGSAALDLSLLQVRIVLGWVEEQVGGHYGGGEIQTPEESTILAKLRQVVTDAG